MNYLLNAIEEKTTQISINVYSILADIDQLSVDNSEMANDQSKKVIHLLSELAEYAKQEKAGIFHT